jgi:hypothetical protein
MLRKAVLALVCLLAAGCGTSEEEQIADVVQEYHRASIAGDAEKACGLTAEEMWIDVACEDIIEINSLPNRRELGKRLAEGEYQVSIDGDTATAQGHNLGTFTLRKVDGEWKLTGARG